MLNTVILQGRLTADPTLRKTANQLSFCEFTLAVQREYKNDKGERTSDFIRCISWRNTADLISKYFHKGDEMLCVGRLEVRKYEDKDGNKRTATEVKVETVHFVGKKSDSSAEIKPLIGNGDFEPCDDEDDTELPF